MKKFLHHLFLPKETNNYRAKILHHKILLVFTLFFFSAGLLMSYVRTNYPQVLGTYSNISNDQLLAITNQDRQAAGLPALSLNNELSQAAQSKADNMFAKDYWAHIAPDGTTPWVFIKASGYNYVYAGENLARGFTTPSGVVDAWMASPSHRENMHSNKYTDVGFAVETGKLTGEDTVLVVEMFGSTNFGTKTVAVENQQKPVQVAIASPSSTVANGDNNKLQEAAAKKLIANPKTENTVLAQANKPLVNGASFSILSARVVLSLFIFVLILDMIIIERKRIVRFVGHNLDHVIFLSLLLLIIFILARGVIL